MPLPAAGQTTTGASAAAVAAVPYGGQSVADFYRARDDRPLWLAPQNIAAAEELLHLLSTANVDGLDPASYKFASVARAVRDARSGKVRSVDRAERLISAAFVDYARALQSAPAAGVKYIDRELIPRPYSARALLEQAESAPSLAEYVKRMGWMNPFYAELRTAMINRSYATPDERRLLQLNMQRARSLPGGFGRYVIVNIPAQRLYMFEGRHLVDSMRVVVGKTKNPTPMLTGFIRYAALNPYWNVPPDLTAERIAPNVLSEGLDYLRSHGYEVLSDWGDRPSIVDPSTIDWQAVADGSEEIRVRQLPGSKNAMGQVKFMFPNDDGIWLHDTPQKELLTEASRLFSGGCVRLEDAPRLGEWLFGRKLNPEGARTEQKVMLERPVPVYLTYLTAMPSGGQVAYYDDIYGHDRARLAQMGGHSTASR